MNNFHEMKKYHRGRSQDGNDIFDIPLRADKDGMVGRECPNKECQPKYFKISLTTPDEISKKIENFSQINLTCPYCGLVGSIQHYHTRSQIQMIESIVFRDVAKTIQNVLEDTFKPMPTSSKDFFSISIEYKPGQLPSVRHYVEQKLKSTVVCDNCGYNYAVYGISFHCPLCGMGNMLQHLNRSVDIIKVLLAEHERITQERGSEVGQQMVGNALEDVVGLFEGFLKHIYIHEIKRRYSGEKTESKIAKIGTTFQRIEGGDELFSKDLDFALFAGTKQDDVTFLQEQFLKRHVLIHNLGLVDQKYIEKAQVYQKQGVELDVKPADVLRALEIVKSIITTASNCIGKKLDISK